MNEDTHDFSGDEIPPEHLCLLTGDLNPDALDCSCAHCTALAAEPDIRAFLEQFGPQQIAETHAREQARIPTADQLRQQWEKSDS